MPPEVIVCRCGSRDRIVVSTLRCGRNNPGSNPGHGTLRNFFPISWFFLSFVLFSVYLLELVCTIYVCYLQSILLFAFIIPNRSFWFVLYLLFLFVCPSHRKYYFKISLWLKGSLWRWMTQNTKIYPSNLTNLLLIFRPSPTWMT